MSHLSVSVLYDGTNQFAKMNYDSGLSILFLMYGNCLACSKHFFSSFSICGNSWHLSDAIISPLAFSVQPDNYFIVLPFYKKPLEYQKSICQKSLKFSEETRILLFCLEHNTNKKNSHNYFILFSCHRPLVIGGNYVRSIHTIIRSQGGWVGKNVNGSEKYFAPTQRNLEKP